MNMTNKTNKIKYAVELAPDHLSIRDEQGEVVYWDVQEWVDDPSLVMVIANAFLAVGRGENVREMIASWNQG